MVAAASQSGPRQSDVVETVDSLMRFLPESSPRRLLVVTGVLQFLALLGIPVIYALDGTGLELAGHLWARFQRYWSWPALVFDWHVGFGYGFRYAGYDIRRLPMELVVWTVVSWSFWYLVCLVVLAVVRRLGGRKLTRN